MIVMEDSRDRVAASPAACKRIGHVLSALRCELVSLNEDQDDHIRKSPVWLVRERPLIAVPDAGCGVDGGGHATHRNRLGCPT